METGKIKLGDVELEIVKKGGKIYVSQNVVVINEDGSEEQQSWLVAEGNLCVAETQWITI